LVFFNTLLVDIGGAAPEYNVMPTRQVEKKLQEFFENWLAAKPTRSAENKVIAF
jgi:hypothetical protein